MSRLFLASMAVVVALLGLVFGIGLLVILKLQLPPNLTLALASGFALLMVLIQYTISPFLIDWVLTIRWADPRELGPEFDAWLSTTCRTFRIPSPRFGIIEDNAPNAFTYGNGPWNARVVVTRGVINALDPVELRAVVAHELGHIKHRDFILMTVVQALVLVLYTYFRMARGRRGDWYIIVAAWIAYEVSYYVSLYLSRIREYMADYASAQILLDANALSSALVKISYGLASTQSQAHTEPQQSAAATPYRSAPAMGYVPAPVTQPAATASFAGVSRADPLTPELMAKLNKIQHDANAKTATINKDDVKKQFSPSALGAFGIAGASSMRSAVTWFGAGGQIDTKNFTLTARWELYNPWARIAEILSTHPLTALRIKALQKLNAIWGVRNQFDFSKVKPAKYRGFFGDLLVAMLPYAVAVGAGVAAWTYSAGEPDWHVGLAVLSGFSFGYLLRLMSCYPSGFGRAKVLHCLGEVNVSHVRAVPVVLEGVFTGRMSPGVPWASDFILQDDTGFITCVFRQPFSVLTAAWGWLTADRYVGKAVVVRGWYRRFGAPYVEVDQFEVMPHRESVRANFRWFAVMLALIGIILPIVIWTMV